MKIDSKSQTPLRHVLPLVALVASVAACSDPGGAEPPETGDEEATPSGSMTSLTGTQTTPANGQEQLALEALEATEVVQVLSLLNGNLAANPTGLLLPSVVSDAIENAKQALGGSCVKVEHAPNASPLKRTVNFSYDQCSGPFQQVSIDGTTITTFEFDVAAQQFTVETADNLMITKGAQQTPVTANATGTLDADGLVLTTQIDFVDFSGQPQSVSGTLNIEPDPTSGCVNASIAPGSTQSSATLEVSDLSICQDGNVCVGSVTFEARDGDIALTFDQGQLNFHISDPSLPNPIDESLPMAIPSCVNVINGVP